MLNENPNKKKNVKNYADAAGFTLFMRVQKECLRRSVTVFLMYMFMSMLMLAIQVIDGGTGTALVVILSIVCILGGCFYNGHLCYHCGKDHYDAYLVGKLHRKNALFGISSGGNHHKEREYRIWKGFLIGAYVGLIVIIFGVLAGCFDSVDSEGGYFAKMAFSMFAGWAILPLTWIAKWTGTAVSSFWSIAFIILPILVSGVFYMIGANAERRAKEEEELRKKAVEEAGQKAKAAQEERVQTEEQRRKTLQSKKKK